MRPLIVLLLPVLLAACSSDAPAEDASALEPDLVEPPVSSADDACGALSAPALLPYLPEADGADIRAEDVMGVSELGDRYLGCSWMWGEGHMLTLQIQTEPDGNRFDTWGSRMLAARAEKGYGPVDGLGDGAAFLDHPSDVFWHEGEARIFSLSYSGPSPQARMDRDALIAIAQAVDA